MTTLRDSDASRAAAEGPDSKRPAGDENSGAPPRQKTAKPPRPKATAAPAEKPGKGGQVVEYPAAKQSMTTAAPARVKRRHSFAAISFVIAVLLPTALSVGYLYGLAHDQYASRVAFSIRGQENVGPMSFLGAFSQTVSGGGADAEIVYELIRSQQMVEAAFSALPLDEIYNVPEKDFVFRLGDDQPIERKVEYWRWMTDVSFDGATGLVNFQARAFDPESARRVAAFVLDESTRIVNEISLQAREDAVSVARNVLNKAEDRLRDMRRRIRAFRDVEQEVDPVANARAAVGLLATLRERLAAAKIELDNYMSLVGEQGPRAPALRQTVTSLEARIAEERERLGGGADGDDNNGGRVFSDLMSEYEELMVELEFAENAYVSALSSFEQAQVEARRQTRFLSPHIEPTLSVEAEYPQRALMSVGIFVILTVAWAVILLILYNIRDRR